MLERELAAIFYVLPYQPPLDLDYPGWGGSTHPALNNYYPK